MDTEIDLKSIIGLIRRQISLIIYTVIAVLILAVIFTFSITPKYQASALVIVDTKSKNLLDQDRSYQNASADNARVDSEVAILGSDRVMLQAIQENDLVKDPEFGVKLGLKDRIFTMLRLPVSAAPDPNAITAGVLNRFRDAVDIKRNGLTYLITVSVRSEDPEKAARLANSITEVYIREQISSKVSGVLAARDTLQKRVSSANAAIADSERSFDSYINDNLARIQQTNGSADLSTFRSQIDHLNALKLEQGNRLAAIQQSLETKDFAAVNAMLGSSAIAELERQRVEIANRLSSGSQSNAIDLRKELSQIEEKLSKNVSSQASNLQKSINDYQKQSDDLRQQLRSSVLQSNMPPEMLTEIYGLQQSAEIARKQYQDLLSRLQEMDAQTDLQLPDSRIVSQAIPPSSPASPKVMQITLIAGVFSLALGFGLALLREHYVGGFVSDDQVESVLRVQLAAITPKQATDDVGKSTNGSVVTSVADLMVTQPLSVFAESVRRLRLALDHAERMKYLSRSEPIPVAGEGQERGTIIMTTSSVPGEGKSTMAVALARAYALTGKSTLLIDCDLRKPSVGRYLNLNPSYDFIDYLRNEIQGISLASMTMKDNLTNLTVLLGGRRSDVATDELVMSEKMSRILTSARRHFDYIILDTPPIAPVVDALYLARHADLIAFVVRWASTSQSTAKRSILALNENKRPDAQIVTILNQQDGAGARDYRSYYGYGYTEK